MKTSAKRFIQKINNPKLYILYAMLLTAITYLLTLTYLDVLGFGNKTILQSDLAGQYISFLQMFKRLLQGEGSLWYTFSEYLGSGAILTYAYYTLNPFNLLLLIPGLSSATIVLIIVILKITLIGGCMEFFLQKGLKLSSPRTILFATCYALNGFVVTLYYNLMWLDAIYMVPIVIYFIMRYVKTGKWLPIVPVFAYLFITNFYMAFIVGVFVAISFILYLCYSTNFKDAPKKVAKKIFRRCYILLFAVILAAGLCAGILVPCAYFLFSHTAEDNFSFNALSGFIPELINAFFIGQSGTLDNSLPFLYCGIPCLLLCPFYFTNPSRSLKKKLYIGGLFIFYWVAMTYLPLYKFMHAFDYPNFYAYRFSFIISFIVVTIASTECEDFNIKSFKPLGIYTLLFIILYSSLIPVKLILRSDEQVNNNSLLCVNALVLFLWSIILFYQNKVNKKLLYYFISTILLVCELSFNGYLCNFKGRNLYAESIYNDWISIEGETVSQLAPKDNEFYRILISNDQQYNSSCYFDIASYNTFSSSDDYNLRMTLKNLGYSTCNRAIESMGSTPLMNMLLGTKYFVDVKVDDENYYILPNSECEVEESSYALPLGYMVSSQIYNYQSEENPFQNQQNLIIAMTGVNYPVYSPVNDLLTLSDGIKASSINNKIVYERESSLIREGRYYYYVKQKIDKQFMMAFPQKTPECLTYTPVLQGVRLGTNRNTYIAQGCILTPQVNVDSDGTAYEVTGLIFGQETDGFAIENIYPAYFNKNTLPLIYIDLSAYAFNINEFKDDFISGKVVATNERNTLFTSIPYDSCWTATIDGSPCAVTPCLEDAFCSIQVPEGEHEIQFTYVPKGAKEGSLITISCAFVYFVCLLLGFLQQRKGLQSGK